jgi:hypothetical protein
MQDEIQRPGDRLLGIAPPGFIVVEGMDAPCPRLAPELRESIGRFSPAQDEPGPACAQIVIERGEAVMQPPARCGAHATMRRGLVIENIDRQHRAFRTGRQQCRLIGQAQVAP